MKQLMYEMKQNISFILSKLGRLIVSIRGTSDSLDLMLDVQFFCSSALLNLASPFASLVSDNLPKTMYAIKKVMAFPLNFMAGLTLFDAFIENMTDYYNKTVLPNANANIVFVGHSLGGGLAKIFGHKYGKAAISFSGPGISLHQTLVKGEKTDKNSMITQSEVIPDQDLVPRVEASSGVKYRVLCKYSPGTCHGIVTTVCMMGLMCQTPHDNFCKMHSTTSGIYDEMIKYADENN